MKLIVAVCYHGYECTKQLIKQTINMREIDVKSHVFYNSNI